MIEWTPRNDGGFDAFDYILFHTKNFRVWRGMVKPAHNDKTGLCANAHESGWLISGHSFDDAMHFATLQEAKQYMEAIVALDAR